MLQVMLLVDLRADHFFEVVDVRNSLELGINFGFEFEVNVEQELQRKTRDAFFGLV